MGFTDSTQAVDEVGTELFVLLLTQVIVDSIDRAFSTEEVLSTNVWKIIDRERSPVVGISLLTAKRYRSVSVSLGCKFLLFPGMLRNLAKVIDNEVNLVNGLKNEFSDLRNVVCKNSIYLRSVGRKKLAKCRDPTCNVSPLIPQQAGQETQQRIENVGSLCSCTVFIGTVLNTLS